MAKARRGKRGGRRNRVRREGVGIGSGQEFKNISGWDSAQQSERRGYVHWPTLDTKKELTPHERRETMRKVRMGEANIGFVKRAIRGTSRLVGHLTPQADTGDSELNKRLEEAFWRRAEHPQAFDVAGKMNFFQWQKTLKEARLRDGDALSVLTEGGERGARVMFYEAHQINDGRPSGGKKPENLYDGVFLDRWGGRAGFRVTDGEGKTRKTIPRERAIYHAECTRPGRVREVSGLAHAVSNFLDTVEILADTKHAIKVAALWGVAMETQLQSGSRNEISEDLKAYLDTAEGTTPSEEGQILTLENITRGGRVQGLPAGASLNTIQDQRPHPNQMALLAYLIRDMAWGVGISPEVLWDVSSINGPAMRYVMADTRRFIQDQQDLLAIDCKRIWMYTIAKEINNGRLDVPEGREWWKCTWIPQADMTIDLGRDGKLELEQVKEGLKTRAQAWGERGMDWETQERQLLLEEKRRRELRREILGDEEGDEAEG